MLIHRRLTYKGDERASLKLLCVAGLLAAVRVRAFLSKQNRVIEAKGSHKMLLKFANPKNKFD
ncbi:hypothetical protein Plhal304r1_c041g0120091 [Plasmopara halstedii]